MELDELSRSTAIELNQRCFFQYVSLRHSFLTYNGSQSRTFVNSPPSTAPSDRLQYMEEFLMKTLLATVALATLLSSSAHAQYGSWRGYDRSYAQVTPYAAYRSYGFNRAYAQVPPYAAYYGAYAQSPYYRTPGFYDLYGRLSPYPYSVYDIRGRYLGSDPDPRVRDQLRRDPSQGLD